MSRNRILRPLLVAFIGLVLWTGPGQATEPPPRFPNVLFLTVDTLRADHMSGYGYRRPTSPNMDRLMAAGAQFTEARCVEPLTGPSLASMITSLYPHEHGASRNGIGVRPGLPSVSKVLGRRGFRTAAIISNWTLRRDLLGVGDHFDEYFEVFTRKRWLGMIRAEATADDVSDAALEWIHNHAEAHPRRPFFAWVHYVEPHAPYRLHADLAPGLGLSGSGDLPKRDRYDTEIAFVDRAVGRLLDELRRLDLENRTLVVFASDHGENLGEHGYWGHGRHLWEEGLRIPMSFTWPGSRLRPRKVSTPASNLDVAPTVLGLLGLPIPESFQGRDWSAFLLGDEAAPDPQMTFHQAHKGAVGPNKDQDQVRRRGLLEVGIVNGSKKETLRLKGGPSHGRYDLQRDSGEAHSLTPEGSAPSESLATWLETVQEGLAAADDLPLTSLDAESVEQLRSLGYLD